MLAIRRADWPASATLCDCTWRSITFVKTNPSSTIGTRLSTATRWVRVSRADRRRHVRSSDMRNASASDGESSSPEAICKQLCEGATEPGRRSAQLEAAAVSRARPRAARTAVLSVSMS